MESNHNNIRQLLQGHSTIPVVTFKEGDDPIEFMDYLVENGVNCIEVTLRTSAGIEAIKLLKQQRPKVLLGAGTVIQVNQLEELHQIGADFAVSPGLSSDLVKRSRELDLPFLPGVVTPSEVMKAMELGLDTLKFFPANLFGGIETLKAYGQLFPQVKFCPTGGITPESSPPFLDLNNVISVGGSWFQKNFNQVKNR